ncbi:MAG: hypothetical protein WKF96_14635 [Solirubrobacteraceae bacterium]
MRKLVVIPSAMIVRDFLAAGAFDGIDDDECYFLSPPLDLDCPLEDHLAQRRGHYLGSTPHDERRERIYGRLRTLLLTSYRWRSRTVRVKLRELPLRRRLRATLGAAPGIRQARIRRGLRETGISPAVHRILQDVDPDIVIVVSEGTAGEVLATDATRSARELGVPVLFLTYNWDNLSSKTAFIARPDHLGVIGYQSAEHAQTIHRFPPERVTVVGSPYIDRHFCHEPGSTESPFPFPYVLFAGCYRPFDERRSLELLDRSIAESGSGTRIVYLPHPRRLRRVQSDFVDEHALVHTVVEPTVRAGYLRAWEDAADGSMRQRNKMMRMTPLPLEAYPALLENARFVVCPLSTMMLEAAIFGRRVLAIAYHDGLHNTSPAYSLKYLHFDRVDRVEAFEVCRRERDLAPTFASMLATSPPPQRPSKEEMDYWIYHDELPFAERLARLVDEIVRFRSEPPGPTLDETAAGVRSVGRT